MSDNNRSYRIHTEVNKDKFLNVNLTQDYDELNILSLKIGTENAYRLHSSKYGCLVGRVLANGGVGVPNVKLSVFISVENGDINDPVLAYLYPYNNTRNKNREGIRYNLLPTTVNDKCHQDIGTFPNKRMVLDDENVIEIYDKYYKYTTTTNAAGDYMIFGLPTGNNIIHSELDLSDIGILSQKPRDLYYKGYNHTQFENSSQFKKDTNLDNLTQVITQEDSVYVYPFWGDDDTEIEGADSQIKITRNDINISYKFEPTCIFIGSIVADEKSQGFSKRCIPTTRMGKMDRLTTGKGTIEMIRKTPTGEIESFSIQGNDLIDGNGTWCYQIPMNLDFVKTDEYGNLVAAENASVGIPTRASVRFRISLADYESDSANAHLVKMLVPNNPDTYDETDYNFGSATKEDSFRDLLWNNVYTVKEYIPRIQKIKTQTKSKRVDRSKNFSGIKVVNVNGNNNPIPYNNIRVQLTFLFLFQCILFKSLVLVVKIMNTIIYTIALITCNNCGGGGKNNTGGKKGGSGALNRIAKNCECGQESSCDAIGQLRYITLDGAICPETDGWLFALGAKETTKAPTDVSKKRRGQVIDHTIDWARMETETYNPGDTTTKAKDSVELDHTGSEYSQKQGSKTEESYSEYAQGTSKIEASKMDGPYMYDPQSSDDKYYERKGADHIFVSGKDDFFIKCVELQFAMEYEVIQFDFYNDWLNGCVYIPRWFAELRKTRSGNKIYACNNDLNADIVKASEIKLVQQCALKYKTGSTTGLTLHVTSEKNDNYLISCGSSSAKCHKGAGRVSYGIFNEKGKGGVVRYVQNMYGKFLYYLQPRWYNSKALLFATDIVLLGNTSECNCYGIPIANGYPSSTFIMPPPTVQIEDESQEGELNRVDDKNFKGYYNGYFKIINGVTKNSNQKEMSGIDWGYNPWENVSTKYTDKNYPRYQRGGHFLEIGCINSMTNTKSCVNLQRICELGAEMSQSHANRAGTGVIDTTGVVANREVIGNTIRMKFATLNSKKLKYNDLTGNYDYVGYIPKAFDNSLNHFNNLLKSYNFIETNSNSYVEFRLGESPVFLFDSPKYKYRQFPIYKNSFYFYFGLRDGNTAIDRLYTEYFSECATDELDK